jgi:murein DD-endopeptidase MepM/ murein hydrolase activator NlpD
MGFVRNKVQPWVIKVFGLVFMVGAAFFALPRLSFSASVPVGSLVKHADFSAVYYVGADGARHPFPNEDAFYSWYEDFATVQVWDDEALSALPLGSRMMIKPCAKLVKLAYDPRVYVIASGGVLRELLSESQASALFGQDWALQVVDVADAFWTDYEIGEAVSSANTYPDGCLAQSDTAPEVYVISRDLAFRIENEDVFTYSGFQWDQIHLYDGELVNAYAGVLSHSSYMETVPESDVVAVSLDLVSSEEADDGGDAAGEEAEAPLASDETQNVAPEQESVPASDDASEPASEAAPPTTVDTPSLVKQAVSGSRPLFADAAWPVSNPDFSSPFGSRLKASEDDRYDFHRGIDIPGTRGQAVTAIADGEVYRTYAEDDPNSAYPGLGNAIVIRHEADATIDFHGSHTEYYSIYGHLETSAFAYGISASPYPSVSKGALIGTIGDSGDADSVHVHYEIRVETTCSRETQIADPTSSCATAFGSEPEDPHVNPFWFHDYHDAGSMTVETATSGDDLVVTVSSNPDELDFNSVRVEADGASALVDFNLREGIDPDNIDNATYQGVTIAPSAFSSSSLNYAIQFTFDGFADFDELEVLDVRGGGWKWYWE